MAKFDSGNERIDTDIEYSAQYFGFTAKRFCNGVYNAAVEYMAEGIKALTDTLIEQHEGDEAKIAEIHAACRDAHKAAVHNTDVYFDKLEKFLRDSIFNVPQHLLLPDDAHHEEIGVDSIQEEAHLDAQISRLQQQIQTVIVHYNTITLQAEQKACHEYVNTYMNLLKSLPSSTENVNLAEQLLTLEKDLKSVLAQVKLMSC